MSRSEILTMITNQEAKLKQQLEDTKFSRGMHEDVIKMMAPVFLDQLKIFRAIVEDE